jgi:putative nucleotidyltransferase-like protein
VSRSGAPAWHPTPTQDLLLRAALEDGSDAMDAWRRWRARVQPEQIEGTALQILPLVSYNLSRIDPDDPDLALIKGVRRHAWTNNQHLIKLGEAVLTELRSAGIETLVLKGLSLGALYYPDVGARPMTDLDVLVRRNAALEAIAILSRSLDPDTDRPEELVKVQHGMPFADPSGREVDLHWYSLWRASPDDDFWDAAIPVKVGGVLTKALSPPDMLLQVCVHGAAWHPTPMIRWIGDAMMVIRSTPDLDWDRLVAQARKRRLTLTLAGALEYLGSAFAAPIPPDVLTRLRGSSHAVTERLATRAADRPQTMPRSLALQWERYWRVKALDPTASRPPSFPAHLKSAWGFERYPEFLSYAVKRALGRSRGGRNDRLRQGEPLRAQSDPPQR